MGTLITPIEDKARKDKVQKVDYMTGLLRQRLMNEEIDPDILERVNAHGDELQKLFLAAVLHLGRKRRTASRLDLRRECQAVGIPLLSENMEEGNYYDDDAQVEFPILTYDLKPVFALRDAGRLPWGGSWRAHEAWAKGGVASTPQTLQAILDHYSQYGSVPDPDRYWWLRCSDPCGFGSSLRVVWYPGRGLNERSVRRDYSAENGGCLFQEMFSGLG